MTEYPRPWKVECKIGHYYVTDARGGIVAGPFTSSLQAEKWMENK